MRLHEGVGRCKGMIVWCCEGVSVLEVLGYVRGEWGYKGVWGLGVVWVLSITIV